MSYLFISIDQTSDPHIGTAKIGDAEVRFDPRVHLGMVHQWAGLLVSSDHCNIDLIVPGPVDADGKPGKPVTKPIEPGHDIRADLLAEKMEQRVLSIIGEDPTTPAPEDSEAVAKGPLTPAGHSEATPSDDDRHEGEAPAATPSPAAEGGTAEADSEEAEDATADDGDSDDLDSMTVGELKAYAADNEIDLGDATKKADIIEAISGALPAE